MTSRSLPITTIASHTDAVTRTALWEAFEHACEHGATVEEWTDLGDALEILATMVAYGEVGIRNRVATCRAAAKVAA